MKKSASVLVAFLALVACSQQSTPTIQETTTTTQQLLAQKNTQFVQDNTTQVLVDTSVPLENIVKVVQHGDHWHVYTSDGKEQITYTNPNSISQGQQLSFVSVVTLSQLKGMNVVAIHSHGDHWHVYTSDGKEYLTYENPSQLFTSVAVSAHSSHHDDHDHLAVDATTSSRLDVVRIVKHGDHYHVYTRDGKEFVVYNDPRDLYPDATYVENSETHHNDNEHITDEHEQADNNPKGDVIRIVKHGDHYHVYTRDGKEFVVYNDPRATYPQAEYVEYTQVHHNPATERPVDTKNYTNEEKAKVAALAKALNLSEQDVWVVDTENGKVLRYRHEDHTHDVPFAEVNVTANTDVAKNEIEEKINYIVDVYGVLKEAVKVKNGLFIFNDPGHDGYDATHIHPYVIPIDALVIPTVTGNSEIDFENELLALATRNHLVPSTIKIVNNKFAIPHGDHDHYVKIKSLEGKELYFKNKLPSIIGEYVAGSLNKDEVKEKIAQLINETNARYSDVNEKRRIVRELEALRETLDNQPNNSSEGYKKMLDTFADVYIYKTKAQNERNEVVEKYNQTLDLLNSITEKTFANFAFNKADLIATLQNNSKDMTQIEAIRHIAKEVEKFDARAVEFKYNYANYFLEYIDSPKISNALREEIAFLTAKTDGLGSSAIKALVPRFIAAKNSVYKEVNDGVEHEVVYGENYNKLKFVVNSIKGNINYYKKYFEKLEFAANLGSDNYLNEPVKPNSENNNPTNNPETPKDTPKETPKTDTDTSDKKELTKDQVITQINDFIVMVNEHKLNEDIDGQTAMDLMKKARVIKTTLSKITDVTQENLEQATKDLQVLSEQLKSLLGAKPTTNLP